MSSVSNLCHLGELHLVRAAIGLGKDVNDRSFRDKTGLMWALSKKHNSIVKLLLEQHTLDLNHTDGQDRSALHFAAMYDNVEGARLLLADPRLNTHNHKDTRGWTPVMAAMSFNKVNTLRELIAHPNVDLYTIDNRGRSLEGCVR